MRYDPEKFEPFEDMVLIKMLKEDNVTAGGVVIPDNVMQGGVQGRVARTGPQVTNVMRGDHVLVEANLDVERSATFEYDGDEYWLIPEDLIMAIVEEEVPVYNPDRWAIQII